MSVTGQEISAPDRIDGEVDRSSVAGFDSLQGRRTNRTPPAVSTATVTALGRDHDVLPCVSGRMPEQPTFLPPDGCSGSSVYLWCPECQEVVDEPGSRDCGGLLCDVCNSNLVDTHGCVDCSKAVGSPEDDWCIGCLAKWQRIDRADLVDTTITNVRAA